MLNLENKVVIVTGAARGIGKAVCEALVEAGCFVVATDVLEEVLMTTARDLGNKVSAHVHDVSDESQWQSIVDSTLAKHGRIDGLVNNAGILLFATLETTDPEKWIESYYSQSEQRPARAFALDDENYVLLAAQPDADLEWLNGLTNQDVEKILETEETKTLETRRFRFHCGCSVDKILPALAAYKDKKEELFQGDPAIEAACPRCGAKHLVTPDML